MGGGVCVCGCVYCSSGLYIHHITNVLTPTLQIRSKMYELLANCIPPELIIKTLLIELIRKLDDELKHKATDLAAQYEHRLQVSGISSRVILVGECISHSTSVSLHLCHSTAVTLHFCMHMCC